MGAQVESEVKSIHFQLPSLPPSHNRLYLIDFRRRQVYLSEAARRWKSDMQFLIPRFEIAGGSLLRIDYVTYYRWHHRNGNRRRVDCSNLMKLLHDTICLRIGVDDSRVVAGSFAAIDREEEAVDVVLTEVVNV